MNIYDLVSKRRTIRSFKEKSVDEKLIIRLIDAARLSPSAANLQSLKYAFVTDEKTRLEMYPYIKYAGYTPEWEYPFEITPTAFIVLLNDSCIRPKEKSEVDAGIALMALSLCAEGEGLGSCIIASVNRAEVKQLLGLDENLDILYLIGIGYPNQINKLVESEEKVKYSLDGKGNFNVPKRPLEEIIVTRKI
jgi:nitroreductase